MDLYDYWYSFPMFIILLTLNELMIMNVDEVVFLVTDYTAQIYSVP